MLSRRLPPKSTFKIMAVSLAGVAVLISGAAGLAHPGEVADLVHRCALVTCPIAASAYAAGVVWFWVCRA